MVSIGTASLRLILAAWLLLANLSLGQHHRHEAAAGPHHAAPQAWHYHVLVLGVELDFLSLNSETCPFKPAGTTDAETHTLLSSLLAPGLDHEVGSAPAPASAVPALFMPFASTAVEQPIGLDGTRNDRWTGRPPPTQLLEARSGVQQV